MDFKWKFDRKGVTILILGIIWDPLGKPGSVLNGMGTEENKNTSYEFWKHLKTSESGQTCVENSGQKAVCARIYHSVIVVIGVDDSDVSSLKGNPKPVSDAVLAVAGHVLRQSVAIDAQRQTSPEMQTKR